MKANCKNCCTKFCTAAGKNDDPEICEEYSPVMTNADRIRAMTDEELANFLMDVASRGGIQTESGIARWTIIEWLKLECET